MNRETQTRTILFAALLAAPLAVWAHALAASGGGLAAGFAHPFFGLDHLLAMIAVGLWSAQLGGHARWAVPFAFVATFTAAAFTGGIGLPLGPMEAGVAASVFALGLLIATAARLPTAVGVALVSAFAVFHGHLHGVEMLHAAQPAWYLAGMVLATAALHAIGLALARIGAPALRASGLMIALAGAALWLT